MNTHEAILQEAIALAEKWQNRANKLLTCEEKGLQKKLARLLTHPKDKAVLTKMIDQSFRSEKNARVADQMNYILREYGIPEFFSLPEKALANLFLAVGRHVPDKTIPRMIERMRADSSRAIIPGEKDIFYRHLQKRKSEGVRMNVNHLGEAVLGEDEARGRLEQYIATLESPEIEYISVKISTIYSQIHSLAFEQSVAVLMDRLTILYRAARDNVFVRNDSRRVPKFVNLDMEEYRDLDITVAAFTRTLDKEEFKNHSAGIVLQAYLPDSYKIQQELTEWARKRVAAGGSPIKLRIVKGANMEMELVESSLHNWPLAPYDNKLDVDANYKRMAEYGMQPENIRAVNLGIASHNLFELAYAYSLAKNNGVTDCFTFEMLEGMADHVRRAIQETSGEIVLYAPVAAREQFINAIGYLVRRLDENTGEENFLRYSADLRTDSRKWSFLKDQFVASYLHREKAADKPNRIQNRLNEAFPEKMGTLSEGEFNNEADTDWSLAANRAWAEEIRARWKRAPGDAPMEIPVAVAGEELFAGRTVKECIDPSRHNDNVCVAKFAMASDEDVDLAVATAKADPDGWRKLSQAERHAALSKVAMEIRKARGDLIGAAAANTGKLFTEADVEVSEAIDFAEYYPYSAKIFDEFPQIKAGGKGVGLVISPWNFPVAIPCGGIVASLAAGNTVVFKPA
ncbi:MAG: proline dehydrogenase family protein, partial [Acidobacteriota bacterium]